MLPRAGFLIIGALILSYGGSVCDELPKAGKNEVTIRAHRQKIYFYPAGGAGQHRRILFAPGDGGCRRFAITITEELAKAGNDGYFLDTRHYLGGLTGGQVLRAADIASDFGQLLRWV